MRLAPTGSKASQGIDGPVVFRLSMTRAVLFPGKTPVGDVLQDPGEILPGPAVGDPGMAQADEGSSPAQRRMTPYRVDSGGVQNSTVRRFRRIFHLYSPVRRM